LGNGIKKLLYLLSRFAAPFSLQGGFDFSEGTSAKWMSLRRLDSLEKKGAQNIKLETRASRPYGHEVRFLFHSDLARMILTLHRVLHHAHADKNMPKRQPRLYRRFFF
jgi:hypothetical protein